MIDTVRYEQEWEFLENAPKGKFLLTLDRKSDLRVGGRDNLIKWIEVALPRLLFGDNYRLIGSKEQIAEAFARADKIISQWAKPITKQRRFTRVDLVWHFLSKPPQKFLFCHEHCNHPEVKKSVGVFRNNHKVNTVEWRGDRMTIRMYDKSNKNFESPQPIVRVEIEMRGRKLKKKLKNGAEVNDLDLMKCYSAYRATLLKFRPKAVKHIGSKDEALFYAEREGVRVFERLVSSMEKQSVRDYRIKFHAYLFKHYKIDWDKLLPANELPPKYDALELKSPTRIRIKKNKSKVSCKKRI